MSAADAVTGSGTQVGGGSAAPLRIGMLGASRIAEVSITQPTADTGDIRAALAARDPERARRFAAENGYDVVYDSYDALIADDSLDLIYIGLPNGLHAQWTVAALQAGRNVLVEKPFAANLAEFDVVAKALSTSDGWAWEAFHYADHPLMARILEIVQSGEIGDVRHVTVNMRMPSPAESDPRWNFELAGGTVMDLGCYAINALLVLGESLGQDVVLRSAEIDPWAVDARLDGTVRAELALGSVTASVVTSMVSPDWDFSLEITGSKGSIFAPNYVKPQEDNRLVVRTGAGSDTAAGGSVEAAASAERVESTSEVSSYTYQLQRIRQAVRDGVRDTAELERSRRTMELIDEIYLAGGLPLRPGQLA